MGMFSTKGNPNSNSGCSAYFFLIASPLIVGLLFAILSNFWGVIFWMAENAGKIYVAVCAVLVFFLIAVSHTKVDLEEEECDKNFDEER